MSRGVLRFQQSLSRVSAEERCPERLTPQIRSSKARAAHLLGYARRPRQGSTGAHQLHQMPEMAVSNLMLRRWISFQEASDFQDLPRALLAFPRHSKRAWSAQLAIADSTNLDLQPLARSQNQREGTPEIRGEGGWAIQAALPSSTTSLGRLTPSMRSSRRSFSPQLTASEPGSRASDLSVHHLVPAHVAHDSGLNDHA